MPPLTSKNGLRRVLHSYINTHTFMSVLFLAVAERHQLTRHGGDAQVRGSSGHGEGEPDGCQKVLDLDTLIKELQAHMCRCAKGQHRCLQYMYD